MQYYYHETLTDLDETGFGVIVAKNNHTYTPPHWHKAMELILFIHGRATVKLADQQIEAEPGGLYLFNSYDIHESRFSRDAEYLCIHIYPPQMLKYVPNFARLRFSLRYSPEDTEKSVAYMKLLTNVRRILQLEDEQPTAYSLERQALLFQTAALLVQHFSQPLAVEEENLARCDIQRLEPILEYAQLHHGEDITLESASNAMGLNKAYFCRLFKKNMGISYMQYLTQIRAQALCRDLESSDETIGELAEKHGFKSLKTLNQCFRNLYGCTPSEKRKQLRGTGTQS